MTSAPLAPDLGNGRPPTDPGAFEVRLEHQHGGDARIHVSGELDAQTAPYLTGVLRHLGRAAHASVAELNLTGVTFLDTHGLAGLIACRAALIQRNWGFLLARPEPKTLFVLEHALRVGWLSGDLAHPRAAGRRPLGVEPPGPPMPAAP